MRNILLGVTGSVAAIKTPKLYEELSKIGCVHVVGTKSGEYFLNQIDFPGNPNYYSDEDEWKETYSLGDPILHIELRKSASALVIAPLDANTLAKIALGFCDNLLTCIVRAWDWNKPMILAPAMNTMMYENSPTAEHLEIMRRRGAIIVDPVEKTLACGDVGMGAMAHATDIAQALNNVIRWEFPLKWCPGIPINHHPGAFGFHRKKNHHTGIDLYCANGEAVRAVEDGTIVHIAQFTGSAVGHTWWNDTWGIMVEGSSGVVNYGEVRNPEINSIPRRAKYGYMHDGFMKVGNKVKRGQQIANVSQVLFDDRLRPEIPGHSCSMLHLELYKHGTREFADWHDLTKNPNLLDPTSYLIQAEGSPLNTLTWENSEGKVVG